MKQWFLILPMLLLALAGTARAATPVVLQPGVGRYDLGMNLDLLEDTQASMGLEEVLSSAQQARFVPSGKEIPKYGFTDSAIWARFTVGNPLDESQEIWLEEAFPHIDNIQIFIMRDGKLVESAEGGDGFAHQNSQMEYRNYIRRIVVPPLSTLTVYLRFQTESAMQMPLILWRPMAFAEMVNREQIILGVYFGIIGAMALYNLFLFFFLGDRNYLFYILFISCLFMAQMGVYRLAFEFFWPAWPKFANLSHLVFFNLTFFFGALFGRSFLGTKKNTPLLDKAILFSMGVCLLNVALTLLFGYAAGIVGMVYFVAIVGPLLMLAAGVLCWSRGLTIARYYTVGWAGFLLGSVVFNLSNMGLMPPWKLFDLGPSIGSAFEVVFLSVALADRIHIIKNERLQAQAKAIAAEKALSEALEKQVEEKSSQVKQMSDLLPICANCKKIRNDSGYWQQVESYFRDHSDAQFSHGICPDCMRKLYPDLADKVQKAGQKPDAESPKRGQG